MGVQTLERCHNGAQWCSTVYGARKGGLVCVVTVLIITGFDDVDQCTYESLITASV